MKKIKEKSPFLVTVYRILIGLIIIMALLLLLGTFYGFFSNANGEPALVFPLPGTGSIFGRNGNPGTQGINGTGIQGAEIPAERTFTGIGRLRLSTAEHSPVPGNRPGSAGTDSAMVILTITFPYPPEDLAYSEELVARVRDFRTLAESYFRSININELRNKKEEEVKAELLERFNSVLRLGKIHTLYFNDFMILDD